MSLEIAILFLLASCHFGASVGVIKTHLNDAQYIQKSSYSPNLSLFAMTAKNHFVGTYQTNRLTNIVSEKSVIFYSSKALASTKLTSDVFSFGYKRGSILPAIFISNSNLQTKITTKRSVFRSNNSAVLYGFNVSAPIWQNITATAFYVFPNHEFRLGNAVGISINYFFK